MVVMDPNMDVKVKPTKEFLEMLSVLCPHGLHTVLSKDRCLGKGQLSRGLEVSATLVAQRLKRLPAMRETQV